MSQRRGPASYASCVLVAIAAAVVVAAGLMFGWLFKDKR